MNIKYLQSFFFPILFCFLFIIYLNNTSAQWVQLNGVNYAISMEKSGNNIIASEDVGAYLSTNNGNNWTYTALNGMHFYSLAAINNNVFAGAVYGGVFLSTNNGIIWTQTPQNSMSISYLALNNYYLFSGTGGGFYRSSNNGINWNGMFTGNFIPYAIGVKDSSVFISFVENTMYNNLIYRSLNNGNSWTELWTGLPDPNEIITCFGFSNTNVFAGCSAGVYCSTNNGTSWYQTPLNNREIHHFAITGNNVFASTISGIYLSTNNGISWTLKDEGFTGNPSVGCLLIANNYIFASLGSIWRRPLSELIVGTEFKNLKIPDRLYLSQNYPNPFNPITNIRIDISNTSNVILKVFDVTGKEISTLINEKLNPGIYETQWNGNEYSSGIYFYSIEAGNYRETKKMILIK